MYLHTGLVFEYTWIIKSKRGENMKPYLVDVPVRVNIWIRPECQRKQFDIIKKARPSILFLQSDGGRNDKEWDSIKKNRKIFDHEVDWDCQIHRIYESSNLGLYTMGQKVTDFIWSRVDRCIFLEDDHIPSVSFFSFCAELLEKYKDDERIEMICGNNILGKYSDAQPYDYFFTEVGWSIWGRATWKRAYINREFPFDYSQNEYIKRCLEYNMTPFWINKAKHYCQGELHDNHVPGSEYFNMANSVLFHRMSIVPTRNMISNIGEDGEHSCNSNKYWTKNIDVFNLKTYEINFPINHPKYLVDDKHYGKLYENKLRHEKKSLIYKIFFNLLRGIDLLVHGGLNEAIHRKLRHKIET